jgi:outer membrane protein assembly factor BamB
MSQRTTNFLLVGAIGCALPASIAGCGGEPAPLDAGRDAGSEDGGLADDAASDAGPPPRVPLDPEAPWPKFRGNALQDGRVAIDPVDDGSAPWIFETGKGVFSTPVVDAEGNVWVGSADRSFYAIAPDGTQRWAVRTGEIIDSAALLDDRGRVYFGSGDGFTSTRSMRHGRGNLVLRGRRSARDAERVHPLVRGQRRLGPDGTLYAPTTTSALYAIDRDTGAARWWAVMPDQTWSLAAVDVATGTPLRRQRQRAPRGATSSPSTWKRAVSSGASARTAASAASPALAGDATFVGGASTASCGPLRPTTARLWEVGLRDHLYASPALTGDGGLIQPARMGASTPSIPPTGPCAGRSTRSSPLRSSPAVDAQDHVYVGSGEGRLFVIDPDGRCAGRCASSTTRATI